MGSATASQALLSHLGICRLTGSAVASRALSPPSAGSAISNALSGPAVASRALLSLQLCYCLSSSIASRALSSFRPCYHLLGSIAPWALLPLGTSPALSPLGSAVASLALLPQSRALLPLGFFYHLLGYIAPRALLSPLGLYIAYCLSGSAIASQALLPLGLRYRPLGLYPLGLCPPTDRVTLSTATISIRVSSPALRQQSITLCM